MTVNEAVRTLRTHLGKSQQAFASELGMSMRAVQRYEQEQAPASRQLFRFECAARDANRPDLAGVFREALVAALGSMPHTPRNDFEAMAVQVLLFAIRGTDFQPARSRLLSSIAGALREARSDRADWFIEEAVRLGLATQADGCVTWRKV